MGSYEALPDNLIETLLAQPQTKRAASGKPQLGHPDSRHLMVWVHLNHTFANCANPTCPDERPRKVEEGKAMCIEYNGAYMCRLCFLAGYGLDNHVGTV